MRRMKDEASNNNSEARKRLWLPGRREETAMAKELEIGNAAVRRRSEDELGIR